MSEAFVGAASPRSSSVGAYDPGRTAGGGSYGDLKLLLKYRL